MPGNWFAGHDNGDAVELGRGRSSSRGAERGNCHQGIFKPQEKDNAPPGIIIRTRMQGC